MLYHDPRRDLFTLLAALALLGLLFIAALTFGCRSAAEIPAPCPPPEVIKVEVEVPGVCPDPPWVDPPRLLLVTLTSEQLTGASLETLKGIIAHDGAELARWALDNAALLELYRTQANAHGRAGGGPEAATP